MRQSRILAQDVGTELVSKCYQEIAKIHEHHEAFENLGSKHRYWNMSDNVPKKL